MLSLGSNLGDRPATIEAAIEAIDAVPGVRVERVSGLAETVALKPHGPDETAPRYLNAVALIQTRLEPDDLLTAINRIEAEFGRVRDEVWGDRTLDIDIVSVEGVFSRTERLTLPHPRAFERRFVLEPWLEVDPDAVLPGRGRVDALLAALEASG